MRKNDFGNSDNLASETAEKNTVTISFNVTYMELKLEQLETSQLPDQITPHEQFDQCLD